MATLHVLVLLALALEFGDCIEPVAQRVTDLLKQMTVDEKAGQLMHVYGGGSEKLKFVAGWGSFPGGDSPERMVKTRNEMQQKMMNQSRLHIPYGFTEETLHSSAPGGTVFPMPVTQGCSWNASMVELIATAIGLEASAVGITVGFTPVLNMITDPRFGRLSEGFCEEPTLSAAYARAAVAGYQGDNGGGPATYLDGSHIISLAKHYAAYGAPAGGLNAAPTQISERTLMEYFLKPWRAFAMSGGRGAMISHESINHIPCHANGELINSIFRDQFNFSNGITISDCNDIGVLTQYRVANNNTHAGAKGLQAGIDIDLMCGGDPSKWSYNNLLDALKDGLINESDIDTACSRVLTAKFASGLFDNPMADPAHVSVLNSAAHQRLAYDAVIEGLVLLKNGNASGERPVLPLKRQNYVQSPDDSMTIAIIGPNGGCSNESGSKCDSVQNMLGPYTQYNGDVTVKTVYEAAKDSASSSDVVKFARGCDIDNAKTDGIDEAVELAQQSDIAVLVLGDSLGTCGEWKDRDSLDLPGAQMQLLENITAVKRLRGSKTKTVILVLISGRPATFGPNNAILKDIDVLLVGFRPGQMGGQAIADVILNGVEPRGRLAQNWPNNVGQVNSGSSPWLQEIRGKWVANGRSGEPDPDGRYYDDYVDSPAKPLFYFGYGLSHSTFEYANPKATKTQGNNETYIIDASVTVHNNGPADGTEVVQIYIQDPVVNHVRYWKRLVGFQKIFLAKGASTTVNVSLRTDDVAMYDDEMKFRVVPGEYVVRFGGHSGADAQTVAITL